MYLIGSVVELSDNCRADRWCRCRRRAQVQVQVHSNHMVRPIINGRPVYHLALTGIGRTIFSLRAGLPGVNSGFFSPSILVLGFLGQSLSLSLSLSLNQSAARLVRF